MGATIEARGFCNKPVTTTSPSGKTYCKFTLAVQQKRKDHGVEVTDKLYFNCIDFDPKNAPADGEYVGVTGYATITAWARDGKNGVNVDVTVKSYEKLTQKAPLRPAAAEPVPVSDPFKD